MIRVIFIQKTCQRLNTLNEILNNQNNKLLKEIIKTGIKVIIIITFK